MNKLLIALACAAASLASSQATTIALWTFESPHVPPTVVGTTISGLLPTIGSGDASGFHSDPTTVYSSQGGNGSANALNATVWNDGDYWQFHTSTLGYNQIQFSWDQTAAASSYGPTNFNLLFSTDGQHFSTLLNYYQVYRNSADPTFGGGGGGVWNSAVRNSNYTRSLDVSGVAALQNASDVYFQFQTSYPGTGYERIDNVLVTGIAVPEPGTLLWFGLPAIALALKRRR